MVLPRTPTPQEFLVRKGSSAPARAHTLPPSVHTLRAGFSLILWGFCLIIILDLIRSFNWLSFNSLDLQLFPFSLSVCVCVFCARYDNVTEAHTRDTQQKYTNNKHIQTEHNTQTTNTHTTHTRFSFCWFVCLLKSVINALPVGHTPGRAQRRVSGRTCTRTHYFKNVLFCPRGELQLVVHEDVLLVLGARARGVRACDPRINKEQEEGKKKKKVVWCRADRRDQSARSSVPLFGFCFELTTPGVSPPRAHTYTQLYLDLQACLTHCW